MSCSTRMMALTPAVLAAPISVCISPCFSAVDTPDVGSSSSITSGFSAKADATSSSFFSPCESRREGLSSRRSSPKTRAISATRALTAASADTAENSRHCLACCETTAAAIVSATVSCGKICTSWNVRAMPRLASTTGPTPVMFAPLKNTSPLLGTSSPVSTLTSVVLPAPFGPTTETNSPSRTATETSSSAQNTP